ncbi:hypothetical protein SXANM310S_00404 [Streptomyces xanthochromogenes]
MKTVWDLISPVSLLVNSAVTKSGAANVKSRSLHSSIEFFGGSKRWSRKVRDIDPEKSSIGEISSKISSRPDLVGTSCPLSRAASTRDFQAALPSSQSKLSVCSARRFGTSRGSLIFAKEMRSGAVLAPLFVLAVEALREAAKRGPSEGSDSLRAYRSHVGTERDVSESAGKASSGRFNPRCSSEGMPLVTGRGQLTGSAKGQCSHSAH